MALRDAIIASVAPHVTVISVSGLQLILLYDAAFLLIASRNSGSPYVTGY